MSPSQKCYDLIKSFEGFRANAYVDPATGAEPITIGYGTTVYADGNKVKLGDIITEPDAMKELQAEVNKTAVLLSYDLTQPQFDAVVSFCYNVGMGNFNKSTLRRKIIANPNDPTIRGEFLKWNKAAGKVMTGLTRRRQAEADLYFSS